jgi:hypothetical protein
MWTSEGRPSKGKHGKQVISIATWTLKQLQKYILHKSLNIDLYGVSSTSKVFLAWVSGNLEKKTSRFLWNMGFSRLTTSNGHHLCIFCFHGIKLKCIVNAFIFGFFCVWCDIFSKQCFDPWKLYVYIFKQLWSMIFFCFTLTLILDGH